MKAWHWALIGVGTVAGVVIIAKVVSSQQSDAPMAGGPALPSGSAPTETGAAIATGAFGLAQSIVGAISDRAARQDAMAERSLGVKAGMRDISSENYDPVAALALKQGRA